MGTCPISAETIKDMGERNCIMNILVRCLFLFNAGPKLPRSQHWLLRRTAQRLQL